MKHMMRLLCLLMVFAMLPMGAQAYSIDSEEKWNKQCLWRTTTTTTVYSAEKVDGEWVFTPIGTVPAGKWLGSRMYGVENMSEMCYWSNGARDAFFPNGTVTKTGVYIYDDSGNRVYIPQLAYGDEEAVRYYLKTRCSPEEIDAFVAGMKQGLTGVKDENGQIVIVKQEPLTPPVITMKVDDEDKEVEMVLPGVVNSTIRRAGEELNVLTASLTWDAGEAEHALARVYAPKNGVASVYARDEGKGGVIKKFKTGSIVLVLGKSGKYTKVFAEGTVGYVITSALEMYDPCEAAQEVTLAKRTYLRLVARDNGHRLAELPEGAVLYQIGETKQWAQVEYQGFVGYVEKNRLEK